MNIKEYERALKLLQAEKYPEASKKFQKLAEDADNTVFKEKCISYAKFCKIKVGGQTKKDGYDPYARAVYLMNTDAFEEAEALLQSLLKKDAKNDAVLYTLASLYAKQGVDEKALVFLRKASKLNEANIYFARQNPDFEELTDSIDKL